MPNQPSPSPLPYYFKVTAEDGKSCQWINLLCAQKIGICYPLGLPKQKQYAISLPGDEEIYVTDRKEITELTRLLNGAAEAIK